ncbi:MAG: hypothetical protein ABIZ05_06820 [Pseudonocardiaceae bacterium]
MGGNEAPATFNDTYTQLLAHLESAFNDMSRFMIFSVRVVLRPRGYDADGLFPNCRAGSTIVPAHSSGDDSRP